MPHSIEVTKSEGAIPAPAAVTEFLRQCASRGGKQTAKNRKQRQWVKKNLNKLGVQARKKQAALRRALRKDKI